MNWSHISDIIQRHRLVYAIAGAICIGLLLTVISMSLYISSGASQLDLSRPGYERARTQVDESKDAERFEANGPMNPDVIEEFQVFYSKNRAKLNDTDKFDNAVIDDTQLRLNSNVAF